MFACLVVSQFNFSHVFNYYFHVHEKIRCEVSKIEFEVSLGVLSTQLCYK